MRREWIEIMFRRPELLKLKSPSMRREWIEIRENSGKLDLMTVSLHAEGVD